MSSRILSFITPSGINKSRICVVPGEDLIYDSSRNSPVLCWLTGECVDEGVGNGKGVGSSRDSFVGRGESTPLHFPAWDLSLPLAVTSGKHRVDSINRF